MADPLPGTPTVTDQRPRPRGVLPRHAQAWLMAGLAVGMLAIIVFTGQSVPSVPLTGVPGGESLAPDPDRLRSYQEQLRVLDAQARQQSAPPATTVAEPRDSGTGRAPDPLETEKRRRDYESLFAGVLVTPRASQAQAVARIARPPSAPDAASPFLPGAIPSVEAITEAVLRASARPPAATPTQTAIAPEMTPVASRSRLPEQMNAPMHLLPEGTVIPVVVTNRLDGSAAAPVNCLVTSPVYAPRSHVVLIPAGARVLGTITPIQRFGEVRLAISFHRLLMPDGSAHSLDHFVGLNQIGDAGLRDQVNHHYVSTFGAAAAVGLLTGLSQALGTSTLNQGDGDRTVILTGGAAEATQVAGRVLDRFLNRLPTITIREGHRAHVYLTSDLELPVYDTPAAAPASPAQAVAGGR